MGQGIRSMLHYLGGGSDEDPKKYYGKTIKSAEVDEERLLITFDDGVTIKLWDDGQSCCECRYITCDDIAGDLVGGKLVEIFTKECNDFENEEEDHEAVFITIKTDLTAITMTTHNEHNGYYGGFGLSVTEVVKDEEEDQD